MVVHLVAMLCRHNIIMRPTLFYLPESISSRSRSTSAKLSICVFSVHYLKWTQESAYKISPINQPTTSHAKQHIVHLNTTRQKISHKILFFVFQCNQFCWCSLFWLFLHSFSAEGILNWAAGKWSLSLLGLGSSLSTTSCTWCTATARTNVFSHISSGSCSSRGMPSRSFLPSGV